MNRRGVVETVVLYYVIAGLLLFFVPNPVSSAVGIGIRPNKTVYKEKVELIKEHGEVIGTKTIVHDDDIQQHVTFWEWLMSLPVFVLFLMVMGIIFPPVALILARLWSGLKKATKQIVVGVDKALDKIQDPQVKDTVLGEMSKVQDTPTKQLVDKIQGK